MLGDLQINFGDHVARKYGKENWQIILENAGLTADATSWVSSCPYADSVFHRLVAAAAEHLGVPGSELLFGFGGHFVESIAADQGYSKMIQCLGRSLVDVLRGGLNDLHLHLSMQSPAMCPPEFRCEKVTATTAELHYTSVRRGLQYIMEGSVTAVARIFFNCEIELQLLQGRDQGTCDHEVYLLKFPHQEDNLAEQRARLDAAAAVSCFTPSEDLFYRTFPFHFIMDQSCNLVQVGSKLQELFPSMVRGAHISETLRVRHPYVPWNFHALRKLSESTLLLVSTCTSSRLQGLELKGQCVATTALGAPALLFMGSPRLVCLDDLKRFGLFMSDIPVWDMARDFILLAEQRKIEADLKERFEQLNQQIKEAKARSDALLYRMMPSHVVNTLKEGKQVEACSHPEVTILFSDIESFTDMCSVSSPIEVCKMLNALYLEFDTLLEEFPALYKVETIGDAYMVVGNLTVPIEDHVDQVIRFGIGMQKAASTIPSLLDKSKPIKIRNGVHTGPVVASVIGSAMPRFCLCGDTVNCASRMESHGIPGKLHVSSAAHDRIVHKSHFAIQDRGLISIKGKGMMKTYLIDVAASSCESPCPASRRRATMPFASFSDDPDRAPPPAQRHCLSAEHDAFVPVSPPGKEGAAGACPRPSSLSRSSSVASVPNVAKASFRVSWWETRTEDALAHASASSGSLVVETSGLSARSFVDLNAIHAATSTRSEDDDLEDL